MFLRLIGYIFGIGAVFFLVVAAGVAWYVSGLTGGLPSVEVLAKYEPPVMTRIHATDGQLVAEYARERRLYLPIQAIPDRISTSIPASTMPASCAPACRTSPRSRRTAA